MYYLYFGQNEDGYRVDFSSKVIFRLDRSAFAPNYYAVFYSCRTGNSFRGGSFAQMWSNQTGGRIDALISASGDNSFGKSDYQYILGTQALRNSPTWLLNIYMRDYAVWRSNRGPVEEGPGEAYRLPQATPESRWRTFIPEI